MSADDLITVTKASGKKASFSEEKLRISLERAGACDQTIASVLDKLRPLLFESISTRKIYLIAFKELRRKAPHLAARYNLKRAIMALGPTGYPFEWFVSEIIKRQGYMVKSRCDSAGVLREP